MHENTQRALNRQALSRMLHHPAQVLKTPACQPDVLPGIVAATGADMGGRIHQRFRHLLKGMQRNCAIPSSRGIPLLESGTFSSVIFTLVHASCVTLILPAEVKCSGPRSGGLRLKRNYDLNSQPLRHDADGRQFAAGLPCACTHAHHAEAGTVDDVSGVVGQTFAIILNGEPDALITVFEADLHFSGLRVPGALGAW